MKKLLLLSVCCTQWAFTLFSQATPATKTNSSGNASLQVTTASGTLEGTLEKAASALLKAFLLPRRR